MADPAGPLDALSAARTAYADASRSDQILRLQRIDLVRQQSRAQRSGDTAALHDIEADLDRVTAELAESGAATAAQRATVAGLLGDFHAGTTPQEMTRMCGAGTPVLLLPLRVETRFKSGELLVRVFPDEIAIDTHEEFLTRSEAADGQQYWRAIGADGTDTALKEAWRKLVDNHTAPRADYVVTRTKPLNWDELASVGVDGLTFPVEPVLKDDGWTQPPRVNVFPDRLVLTLFRAGAPVHAMIGNLIPDVVHAGPAPLTSEGTGSWTRGADGRLEFDADSQWLRDFDTAVAMGLGFRLALTGAADAGGFDELIVLGLKHSASPDAGADLLTELFGGHRYSAKGLALVAQGTATNNTSADDAGLDTIDWFADASFAAQQSAATTAPQTDAELDAATDGDRLAAYLGIAPETFARVPHADGRDHVEAVAMNTALYPGTLGYFLRAMIGEVADDTTLDALRDFYIHWVTGRGPLSAIRVGNQPYGIVVAGPPPAVHPPGREAQLALTLEGIIAKARPSWAGQLAAVTHIGATGNASADLLGVLGLQPTAAEYYQRIGATYDHLANLAGFESGDWFGDVLTTVFGGLAADTTLFDLGYQKDRADGSQKPYPLLFQLIYQRHQTNISPLSLIDGLPFSEQDPIKPYDAARTKNYIDWLAANARSAAALRAQDFAGADVPTTVLYRLLRHALLVQTGFSINRFLALFDIAAPELVTSRKFLSMTPALDIAAWEILSAPASAVRGTVDTDLPLLSVVHLPDYTIGGPHPWVGSPLTEMLAAYPVLRGLPTARLERLFAEHVDTLSYRIDTWETGLAAQRLIGRRGDPELRGLRGGVYLGGVGYLQEVRPTPVARQPVSAETLPESMRDDPGDLYASTDSAGYVHAPSLNHATAAAVLRNGYLTHATPDEPGRLAINLSSRRVRRAEELMAGVRNGQPMQVLLGIEFERGLHDATTRAVNPVVLNDLKPAFRQAFPVHRTKVPPAGHPDEGPQIVPDFSVANGLDIIAAPDTFPTGVPGLPTLTDPKTAELRAIREQLTDSLDSLRDVVSAECAYQLALGNFERAAAIVQSLSSSAPPPDIEVTGSSRGTGLAFTQRLTLELDPAVTANPWPQIAMTTRARLEAPLNNWVGSVLGDPNLFACTVSLTEPDGTTTTDTSVLLADLTLQPLDVVAISRGIRTAARPQELQVRVREAALAATGFSRAATVVIGFTETGSAGPAVAPMGEALAAADLIGQVLADARPIDGRDAVTVSKPLPTGTETSGIDVADLRARLGALLADTDALATDLGAATADANAAGAGLAQFAALRAALRRAADAAVPYAFPDGTDDTLAAAGSTVGAAVATLLAQAAALDTDSQAAGLTPAQAATTLIAAIRQLVGADFPVLPRFTAPNAADLQASEAARAAILATAQGGDPAVDPVSEVLTSVAQIRPAVHRVHRLRLVADLLGDTPAAVAAIQLPPREDDVWLGAGLPAGHDILDDTLSLIQLRPQGFAPAALRCGLLLDEWTESLPRTTEVTGIAFGYDQPNSAPLQSLLLAVAGAGELQWSWDELIGIVRETILRAKLRAVEPDMLDKLPGVTSLVPATMAEFSTSPGALSLDFGLSVLGVILELASTTYLVDYTAAGSTP